MPSLPRASGLSRVAIRRPVAGPPPLCGTVRREQSGLDNDGWSGSGKTASRDLELTLKESDDNERTQEIPHVE